MARFGLHALRPARRLARGMFRGTRARALFAGIAAHSSVPLEEPASAAIGARAGDTRARRGMAHRARGGSQRIGDALASYLRSLGGRNPHGFAGNGAAAGGRGHGRRRAAASGTARDVALRRFRDALMTFRYGPGVFKIDWALDGPIPWRSPECARAATVHLGGTLEEIEQWERDSTGRPFLLVTQPSLFDPSRARPKANTRRGPIAMCRTGRRRHDGGDRGPDRALRARVSGRGSWRVRLVARRRSNAATRT